MVDCLEEQSANAWRSANDSHGELPVAQQPGLVTTQTQNKSLNHIREGLTTVMHNHSHGNIWYAGLCWLSLWASIVHASQGSAVAHAVIDCDPPPRTNQTRPVSYFVPLPEDFYVCTMTRIIESLRRRIECHETALHELRQQLAEAEHNQQQQEKVLRQKPKLSNDPLDHDMNFGVPDDFRSEVFAILDQEPLVAQDSISEESRWPLEPNEYKRYGRQLIMGEIGLQGQLKLRKARVLIVGMGGLGCPAAAYLAGAGVGTLGLIDGDVVEESNLHRQILHSTARVGMTKVESAMVALSSLNPNVKLAPHTSRLTPDVALAVFRDYDLVLDCTDNPASRYLISDTCVLLGKTLVSASALRTDGQLMVLNNPPLPTGNMQGGPCYRCIFPKPPPPESVVSCGDGGILGPVVGVMGVLQALEAIKVLTQTTTAISTESPSLLLFSAYSNPMFRSIRLRTRKPKCAACSAQSTVTPDAITSGSLDYVQFCGSVNPVDALSPQERISAESYAKLRSGVNPFTGTVSNKDSHILIDTRERVQFELCNIDGSRNVPFSEVSTARTRSSNGIYDSMEVEEPLWIQELRQRPEKPIFVVCRLGNDSQMTVRKLKELGLDYGGKRFIGDIRGGLKAWKEAVDHDFPEEQAIQQARQQHDGPAEFDPIWYVEDLMDKYTEQITVTHSASYASMWSTAKYSPRTSNHDIQQQSAALNGHPLGKTIPSPHSTSRRAALEGSISPALLLGTAIAIRGDIGLLIAERFSERENLEKISHTFDKAIVQALIVFATS
ncbi:hypothetical protein OPT61_g3954 [Boeremia exigua]|uniref:Uncharacterized protein n=1 Tax=Boeremia exigua TaxID=749465 RepID=A0ACC2IG00_9PLEO|nr:hypothetical protein OPT61_g3954 [Boeremia exigua]